MSALTVRMPSWTAGAASQALTSGNGASNRGKKTSGRPRICRESRRSSGPSLDAQLQAQRPRDPQNRRECGVAVRR